MRSSPRPTVDAAAARAQSGGAEGGGARPPPTAGGAARRRARSGGRGRTGQDRAGQGGAGLGLGAAVPPRGAPRGPNGPKTAAQALPRRPPRPSFLASRPRGPEEPLGLLPMVEMKVVLKASSLKRKSRQVLPTPESPISSSLNR